MIRLAAFDIDRTLIAPQQGAIAPETADALHRLQQRGIKIAIASGRLYSFLHPDLLEVGFDYFILSNGACVTDREGNMLAQVSVKTETVDALVAEMIRRDFPINVRYSRGQYNGNPNCTMAERMAPIWEASGFRGEAPKAFLEEYEPEAGESCIGFGGYLPQELVAEFSARFPELDFLPVFEGPMCDINPAGVSKATGLELICGFEQIAMEQTIAFGDDRNDLELIQAAGIGVAMENGIQELKNAADYVAGPCDELGVVKALQHFGLLE